MFVRMGGCFGWVMIPTWNDVVGFFGGDCRDRVSVQGRTKGGCVGRTRKLRCGGVVAGDGYMVADEMVSFVLSHFEAAELLRLRFNSGEFIENGCDREIAQRVVMGSFSVNLGRDLLSEVVVTSEGVQMGVGLNRTTVTWDDLARMAKKGKSGAFECFPDTAAVEPRRIATFSDATGRAASLLPVDGSGVPPTAVLAGFGMHRFKSNCDPLQDTLLKLSALDRNRQIHGRVLDICTGLGYTAIELARLSTVKSVHTIELDPGMVELQSRNPWSRELFVNPKIERVVADATDHIVSLNSMEFSSIIHDPPAQAMSGELYTTEFYEELFRVLRFKGKLYHYIGDPRSRESGRLYAGVIERLYQAGFSRVKRHDRAFGVTACR
uniref:Methyltransferase domain-containing protein n=1 Tax=Compsopogon caeruleus TaxID=31354 RepID=A0A7S1TCJ3_9RHOD|mmetsp:Transcript_16678/g.34269  ORF Transcript_16678/g.34269 Transcript_16678/m.34269 type:complete len:380 (+) Transcript_16678:191-1330(+)